MKLAPSKHVEGRWLVWLEDGSFIRIGRSEVADFGLYEGMELTEEKTQALLKAAEESAMRRKALDALSLRPLSRRELVNKLIAKTRGRVQKDREEGDERDEDLRTRAEAVAERLEELGLLDDREYACQVARHYIAKGYGLRKVRDELFRRGVPREHWEEALSQLDDSTQAIDRFLQKRLQNWSGDSRQLKRAFNALVRRGFSWEEISEGLRRFGVEE